MGHIKKAIKSGLRKISQQRLFDRPEEIFSDTFIRPDDLCGTWESVNLNPSLIIYKDHSVYKVSIIHIAASGQAAPSTYGIEKEDETYFIRLVDKRAVLTYDCLRDVLSLDGYGSYMRN